MPTLLSQHRPKARAHKLHEGHLDHAAAYMPTNGQLAVFNATSGTWECHDPDYHGVHGGGGGGAKAIYINLINHFTTLELTASAAAAWKIPAAATYGQVAVYLDMVTLGTPASAQMVVVYTNTATSGTNKIGITLGSAPRAAGTTVTQVASSEVTMANTSTYPLTIVKALTPSQLGTTAQWAQLALNLASASVGPNIMHMALILYF